MTACTSIRLVIADDCPIYRKGLVSLIDRSAEGKIRVVGQAEDGGQLIKEVEKNKPDVVLTDIRMPVLDGVEASRIINRKFVSTSVIALTMFSDADVIYQMFEAGAKGFLTKTSDLQEVIEAIHTVHGGEMHYCSTSSVSLVKKIGPTRYNQYHKNSAAFSDKEIEIMKLICVQLTTKEIADRMKISPRTVEEYSHNIRDKIDAKNIVGIALYALKNSIVNFSEI